MSRCQSSLFGGCHPTQVFRLFPQWLVKLGWLLDSGRCLSGKGLTLSGSLGEATAGGARRRCCHDDRLAFPAQTSSALVSHADPAALQACLLPSASLCHSSQPIASRTAPLVELPTGPAGRADCSSRMHQNAPSLLLFRRPLARWLASQLVDSTGPLALFPFLSLTPHGGQLLAFI